MNGVLIYFAIKYKGDWDKIYKALSEKERISIEDLTALEEKIKKEGWKIVTVLDTNYPLKMKEAYKPAFVLWIKGNEKLLKETNFMTFTGELLNPEISKSIKECVPEITKGNSLVLSGQGEVQKEIAEASPVKPILYVIPSGLDKFTSKGIKKTDLVLTEYPMGVESSKETIRANNRLIASTSQALVLLSSTVDGDYNHLASSFLNVGKEIYCFGGDGSEKDGNSNLIQLGAQKIKAVKDISR